VLLHISGAAVPHPAVFSRVPSTVRYGRARFACQCYRPSHPSPTWPLRCLQVHAHMRQEGVWRLRCLTPTKYLVLLHNSGAAVPHPSASSCMPSTGGLVAHVSTADLACRRIQVQHGHGNIFKSTFAGQQKRCGAFIISHR